MRIATKAALARTRRPRPRRSLSAITVLFAGALLLASLVLASAVSFVWLWYRDSTADFVPLESVLSAHQTGITEVYDRTGPAGGLLLGTLSNPNGQVADPVPISAISPWAVAATISTEDSSFYSNPGVDPRGLARAAYENYAGGAVGSGSGGSTITQQLVKNIYLRDQCSLVEDQETCLAPRTVERKLKEIAYAVEVDKRYSKEQVLEWYLNIISYGDRYVGIEAASEGYFHKPAKDLTLAEGALLAGIPAAPTAYHPRLNCVRVGAGECFVDAQGRTIVGGEARTRQAYVLNLMVEHGSATQQEADAALSDDVRVFHPAAEQKAAAWIDDQVEPRLVRMCDAGLLPRIPGAKDCTDSVHTAGYQVTSSLDWAKTQEATAMMNRYIVSGLASGCDCHNAAIVTIEPTTGQIMVYAPNVDPTWVSDPKVAGNIDQAIEINQPGSSFKPVVYLAWFDLLNKTPMSSIWDTSPLPLTDPKVTKANQVVITNSRSGNGGEGLISARAALGGSQNVPAFRAANEVGVDNVIAYAKKMGITTLDQHFDPTFHDHSGITYGEAIATGGANVRVVDMAYVNATIANMGKMVGVPTLAATVEPASLADGGDQQAIEKREFIRGDIRLPGTRALDPVVVLEVRTRDGQVVYKEGEDLQTSQVVDAGSVWMLYSIQSDCTARFIIWACGGSNDDLGLDTFLDGKKIAMGIKTGTQQGGTLDDTLETWMNGYTRYAATSIWVGNSDNSLVRDGRPGNFASANTTVRLFKNWMAQYHQDLKTAGAFITPASFDEIRPANVIFAKFQSATTERGRGGGCFQMVDSWQRTDVKYGGDCNGTYYMTLPELGKNQAMGIAFSYGIPVFVNGHVIAPAPPAPLTSETPAPSNNTPSPAGALQPPRFAPPNAATTAPIPSSRGTPPPPPTPTPRPR